MIDFASFVVSWVVSWNACSCLTVKLSQAQAIVVVYQIVELAAGGPLIDWICMRELERYEGIREPKLRLPGMIFYALIMILGNFLVAAGY